MSIHSVQLVWPSIDNGPAGGNLPARQNSSNVQPEKSAQPDPGTSPKQEIHLLQNTPAAPEIAKDEVQVQRDSQTNDEVVIRYMNSAGDVILQVPSSQMLGITRAIHQDFEQAARARATAPSGEGGDSHGH